MRIKMTDEEFSYVKLGELYVKNFKLTTVMTNEGCWRVRREVAMTNDIKEAIPIEKTEAQGIVKLLDKNAVLIEFGKLEGNSEKYDS